MSCKTFISPQPETGHWDGGVSVLLKNVGNGKLEAVDAPRSGMMIGGDAMALTTCDLNSDGRPDFVVSQNNQPVIAYQNQVESNSKSVGVRLVGKPGNTQAIGSQMTLRSGDLGPQVRLMQLGGSYLSQSSPVLFFHDRCECRSTGRD